MASSPSIPDGWKRVPFVLDARAAGARVFAVGGAVRDLILGVDSHELDVVVAGLDLDALSSLLARSGSVSFVGRSFGVFKWTPPGGPTVDVAVPRRERSTGTGHREFEVEMSPGTPIEEDLARRDFTLNAVAVELPEDRWIDPFGGALDASARRLRAVGDPRERFREDPLRILRGAGFVARFGLQVDAETHAAMAEFAPLLRTVASERIASEFVKLVGRGIRPSEGLRLLRDTGGLVEFLPEFGPAIGFDQRNPHHDQTLDEHTFAVVDGVAARGGGVEPRLAALFHDLAKPRTAVPDSGPGGATILRYLGHERRSAESFRAAAERLRLSSAEGLPRDAVERVATLVQQHRLDIDENSPDAAVRRLVHRVGGRDAALDLVTLWAADRAAHREPFDERRADALRNRIAELGPVPMSQHDLAIDGRDLAARFGVHGPALGALKDALLERVVDGTVANEAGALLAAAERLVGRET